MINVIAARLEIDGCHTLARVIDSLAASNYVPPGALLGHVEVGRIRNVDDAVVGRVDAAIVALWTTK
jgi:drug/metabolite transporter superfamily protein YnfA